jgi:hypothetical protein
MQNLTIALAGTIKDDKNLIHGGVGSDKVSLSLDDIAAEISARAGTTVPVEVVAGAIQKAIDKADATDTIPGDGAFEAGFEKSWKIKQDIWFVHLRDNITAEAGIVAKIETV